MSARKPLRLVLMDGRIGAEHDQNGTVLVATRGNRVRRITLDDLDARIATARQSNFLRFCVIGAMGFLADAALLFVLVDRLGHGALGARVFSILIAVTVTWSLHRHFTFRSTDPGRFGEWLRFLAVNGGGAGINFAVYASVLLGLPGTPPLLALVMGSAAALAANYLGSKFWAFRAALSRPV